MPIQRRSFLLAATVAGSSALLVACGGDSDASPPAPTRNVVEVAKATPDFSTLVEALTAAGLITTLSGPGPLTVFAPTNAAFTSLLSALGITQEQLLADKALLTSVLTYHVLPARVDAAAVAGILGQPVTTVQGGYFKIENTGGLKITDGRNRVSAITATDIAASNGVIHRLDTVLLPPDKTVVQTAQSIPDLSLLVEALEAADLTGVLGGAGPFTVFAPTNAAFAALLLDLGFTQEQLLADTGLLTQVLAYHVVDGLVLRAQVPVGTPIPTRQGATFTVGPDLAITDQLSRRSQITATDILASDGALHVIDKVLVPLIT